MGDFPCLARITKKQAIPTRGKEKNKSTEFILPSPQELAVLVSD
jgi:hypothetical protein